MSEAIDYYLTLNSPWSYLGGARLQDIARKRGVAVNVKLVDPGRVFAVSGGLPLPKRAPQRQAYRLLELKRWSEFLSIPLTLEPAYFPADCSLATYMVLASPSQDGDPLELANALGRALWAEEKNIGDPAVLKSVVNRLGLDGESLSVEAQKPEYLKRFQDLTEEAIDARVFGMPTYIYKGEMFWGQDRLGFLERALPAA